MEENIDHNQSGLPVKEDEIEPKHVFNLENDNQESGPIEGEEVPEPEQVADYISQVPRMVWLYFCLC
jgi:hypothetical protein